MSAYYNENDPKAAAWLRELIRCKLITEGEVDERSIADVLPADVAGFKRVHFFAGIGGWDYALQLAGWTDRPVWTGSCPCQPFSVAGKGEGIYDPRHLWPEFARLIAQCNPAVVFGEQVASKDGRLWLSGVRADLETLGYAVGAADLCAAGVGAPHIRQRLYWVADAGYGVERHGLELAGTPDSLQGEAREQRLRSDTWDGGNIGGMGDAERDGLRIGGRSATNLADKPSHWSLFDILPCTDGKSRRVESGTFPLAHGIPARVGRLRGYGNAIVPQVAAEFVRACQ